MRLSARLPAPSQTRSQTTRLAVSLWLGAVALALLFLLLLSVFEALQGDADHLRRATVAVLASRVSSVPEEDLSALRATAAELTAAEEALRVALHHSQHAKVPWVPVLQQVVPSPPAEIELTSLAQQGNTLTVRGRAANSSALTSYVARFRGSSLFTSVRVEAATDTFVVTLVVRV